MANGPDITQKQHEFCVNYVITRSPEKAAVAAGYSPRSAERAGRNLLKNPRVAAKIEAMDARRAIRAEINSEEVLDEVLALAMANIGDFLVIEPDQEPRIDLAKATPAQLKALKSVKTTTQDRFDKDGELIGRTTRVEIALWDKLGALDTLMRHLGLFAKENAQQGAALSAGLVEAVRQLHRAGSKAPIRTINATALPGTDEGD